MADESKVEIVAAASYPDAAAGTDQSTVSTPASALPEPMPKRARVDRSLESFASSELSSRNETVPLTSAEPESKESSLEKPHCS
jgi:hypothetical protein